MESHPQLSDSRDKNKVYSSSKTASNSCRLIVFLNWNNAYVYVLS